jgi:hypothetical protein
MIIGMQEKATVSRLEERRKDKRLQVQDGAFAMLSLQLAVLGQIENISRSGLAFRYVASQDRSTELSALSIFLTDGSFSLKRVPIRTVWDYPVMGSCSSGLITVRYCGMRFDNWTNIQISDLNYFIQNFTLEREKPTP